MIDYISEFDLFLKNTKNSSKNTLESYTRDIKAYLSYLDNKSIIAEKADKSDIVEYINYLKGTGKTHSTAVRILASIRCFYQYMIFTDKIDCNPTKDIKLEKVEKKLPEILSSKEVDSLLSQPDISTIRGCRDKAMLEILYATGLRVTELIDLSVDDLNLQVSILHCHSAKSERIIPIYKSAVKAVEDYLARVRPALVTDRNVKYLFLNLNGEHLTRQGFWKIIKGYSDAAGIEKSITPHTLRHSFAAHLLENGAEIKDIKEMLGHSGISSTQIYKQIVKQKFEGSYNKFHPRAGM